MRWAWGKCLGWLLWARALQCRWYYWPMHHNTYQKPITRHIEHWRSIIINVDLQRCQAPRADQWQSKLSANWWWESYGWLWIYVARLNGTKQVPLSLQAWFYHWPIRAQRGVLLAGSGGLATLRDWTLQCTLVGENKAAYLCSENTDKMRAGNTAYLCWVRNTKSGFCEMCLRS